MNIGEVSRLTGLSARTIRHYEALGIIGRAQRGRTGYRSFSDQDLRTLFFVRNARELRFELKEIGDLVRLWRTGRSASAQIQAVLAGRLRTLRRQEADLRADRRRLEHIARRSAQSPDPGCGIISMLIDGSLVDQAREEEVA